MFRLLSFSILIFITVLVSCDKGDNGKLNNEMFLEGAWNATHIKRFNTKGVLLSEEALDTTRVSKLSIHSGITQSMHIDTLHLFYFLMYSSYEYENGIFKTLPDSLLDIDLNMYYWNATDSTFGTFPVLSYPFESTIEQFDNEVFVEKRSKEHIGSIEISYNRISHDYFDLSEEFIAYSRSLENTRIMNESNSNRPSPMPVYNVFNKLSGH